MHALRSFLARHLWLFALVLAMALAMKALVPAGFMIESAGAKVLTVGICDSQGHTRLQKIALPGKPDTSSQQHAKAAKECPFTALSAHALGHAEPTLLALALAFILALGFLPAPPLRLFRPRYWTPPLRAPPHLS
ncbi:DUF2946 family protein [Novosphingobium sp. BW1]|uniref:DUF2946 family protein n=1 Tax=Novosphingobium sp. BW1 TaxID=2592621 RepID=UPI0011DECEA6|nr:DUF2946 family protein [Novosphingobium sp. BW1]TYC92903.1 DUF2946 domain-containing protein [Novosphingobium sp. BW1]